MEYVSSATRTGATTRGMPAAAGRPRAGGRRMFGVVVSRTFGAENHTRVDLDLARDESAGKFVVRRRLRTTASSAIAWGVSGSSQVTASGCVRSSAARRCSASLPMTLERRSACGQRIAASSSTKPTTRSAGVSRSSRSRLQAGAAGADDQDAPSLAAPGRGRRACTIARSAKRAVTRSRAAQMSASTTTDARREVADRRLREDDEAERRDPGNRNCGRGCATASRELA